MAKEIDKIIQSKTAPKSNNVLWDDGENLKINRNGKWESTGSGTSIPQEKLDSIDFGYYTYASGNIVANWGPFIIKERETIKVETNTWEEPKFVKINDYSGVSYIERGGIYELYKNLDGTSSRLGIQIKLQGTTLEIYNDSGLGTITISFLEYRQQYIDSTKFDIDPKFLAEIKVEKSITTGIGKQFEHLDLHRYVGKNVLLDWGSGWRKGFCILFEFSEVGPRFTLLQFPSVIYVTYNMDNNRVVTDVQVDEKTISLV